MTITMREILVSFALDPITLDEWDGPPGAKETLRECEGAFAEFSPFARRLALGESAESLLAIVDARCAEEEAVAATSRARCQEAAAELALGGEWARRVFLRNDIQRYFHDEERARDVIRRGAQLRRLIALFAEHGGAR